MIQIKTYTKKKQNSSGSSDGSSGSSGSSGTVIITPTNDWFFFDSDNNAVGCRYDLYSIGNVSAYAADPNGGGLEIVDNCNSTSATAALAANQGRVLNNAISAANSQIAAITALLPVTLYETDGTTGLLGVNNNALGANWQLTDYDFTPYKYLRCYIKMADMSTTGNALTPSMVIILPLDTAALAKTANDSTTVSPKDPCDMYVAGGAACNPSDQNRVFNVLVAVDSTKTKFQVVCENSLYGTAQTNRNTDGRYCYKIEGCFI